MDTRVHIRSTWRDPIGPLLTTRRIRQRKLEGWYGPQMKLRAEQRVLSVNNGVVVRCCVCDGLAGVRFLKFSYLPKTGNYCLKCRKGFRSIHLKEIEDAKKWQEHLNKVRYE